MCVCRARCKKPDAPVYPHQQTGGIPGWRSNGVCVVHQTHEAPGNFSISTSRCQPDIAAQSRYVRLCAASHWRPYSTPLGLMGSHWRATAWRPFAQLPECNHLLVPKTGSKPISQGGLGRLSSLRRIPTYGVYLHVTTGLRLHDLLPHIYTWVWSPIPGWYEV